MKAYLRGTATPLGGLKVKAIQDYPFSEVPSYEIAVTLEIPADQYVEAVSWLASGTPVFL